MNGFERRKDSGWQVHDSRWKPRQDFRFIVTKTISIIETRIDPNLCLLSQHDRLSTHFQMLVPVRNLPHLWTIPLFGHPRPKYGAIRSLSPHLRPPALGLARLSKPLNFSQLAYGDFCNLL